MPPFIFNTAARIVIEPGAAARLAELMPVAKPGKLMFVTDAGIVRLGLCAPALASLEAAGWEVIVFDAVEPDPSLKTLMAAIASGVSNGISAVVGFGGGSSLDVAKLVALICGSGEELDGAWGVNNARGPRLPLLLVPTTAGTGSEVTPVAIITVSEDEKRGVSSPLLQPDVAVLDARLTLGLPAEITAATGVDAMVHAIESYASTNANNNPLTRLLAREALRLLGANIARVISHPSDVEARGAMLYGSMLAGMAFGNAPVAAVHALAYPIGSMFHVSHGRSNALVLPHVLRFNAPVAANIYAEIAADAFPALAEIADPVTRCAAFIERLAGLVSALGMPIRLRDVGITEEALAPMARAAIKQTRLLVNNPRAVREKDALAIYQAAW